jgi:hypothetical protein
MTILPQLEKDLRQAARAQLPAGDAPSHGLDRHDRGAGSRAAHRPRIRGRFGATAAAALSVAVVVVVAGIALTVLKHGRGSVSTATVPAGAASRRELIDTLGILRTPQTKAEREIRHVGGLIGIPEFPFSRHRPLPTALRDRLAMEGYPRVDLPLVRVVSAAYDQTVRIVPITYRPSPRSRRRAEGLGIALEVPGSLDEGLTPQSVSALRSHGLNLFTYARHANVGVILVPDGVAKVTLGPFRAQLETVEPNPAPVPTTTAKVRDNIAAFRLPVPSIPAWAGITAAHRPRMSSAGAFAHMTWLDANGNVIKRATILVAFNFIVG